MDKHFNAIENLVQDIRSHIESRDCDGRRFIWFGYTMQLNAIQQELMKFGRGLDFAIDNEESKWGLNPLGIIQCCSPEILHKYVDTGIVFIASMYREEMAAQVKSCGYPDDSIIYLKSPVDYQNELEKLYSPELSLLRKIELSELKAVLVEALKVLRDFCNEHNLRYYLAEGTLLGAIRHKGFIPWDNDIDIFMPYEDYEKLVSIYPKEGRYKLLHWRRSLDYRSMFARLADSTTLHLGEWSDMRYELTPIGVDIFPIGGFPKGTDAQNQRIKEVYEQNILWVCTSHIPDDILAAKTFDQVEKIKYKDSFYSSEYVGMFHFVSKRISPWVVNSKHFSSCIDVEFEGEFFKAPKGYHEYLTARYCDYMTTPPENERFTHNITAYWKD